MGQEIVYCHKCQSRLLGSDFEKGKAFRLQNVTWCGDCAKSLLDSLPAAERAALLPSRGEAPKASTSRIPVLRPPDPSSSARHRVLTDSTNLRSQAVSPRKSPLPLVLGLVGGLIAIVLVVAIAASGSGRPRPKPEDSSLRPDPAAPPPRDPRPTPQREQEARRLYEQAKAFATNQPSDLAGQLERFRQAAFAADGTSISEEAKRDFEAAQARLTARVREEGARLDQQTAPLVAQGSYKDALRAIETARASLTAPEWIREIERRSAAVVEAARAKFGPLKAAGVEAKQRRKDADLSKAREAVAALGVDALLREFDEAVAVAVPLSTPPPAAGTAVVGYEDALGKGWQNWSWGGDVDLKSSTAFEGTAGIAWTPKELATGLYLAPPKPLEADQFQAVTFALYRVDPDFSFALSLYTVDGKHSRQLKIPERLGAPPVKGWKKYVVPLSELEVQGRQIKGFVIQAFRTATQPCIYVDSVAFLKVFPADATAVKPVKPPLSPGAKAYQERFLKAADHALARDYAAAAKLLEEALAQAAEPAVKSDAQADVETFRAIQALLTELAQILSRWPRGQNLAVDVRGPAGNRRVDEPVRRAGPHRAEIRDGAGTAGLEHGEIAAHSLADLYLAKTRRSEAETRAAAVFCALEGELAAAKRLYPALPERYETRAKAAAKPAPKEAEALKLFAEAEREHASYGARSGSIEKYARLLADYKDTAFVRRNHASLASREETLKEFYVAPADFRPAGVFSLQRHAKGEVGWTAQEDVTDKAVRKDHYVEAEFSAPAGSEYRAWVFAGGCCVETFSFFLQATELEAPDAYSPTQQAKCEPGSTFLTPVAPSISFLKKFHVQHGGRKEPSRFEWVALPPLKFGTGGPKKLRIISDQEGFTAAALFLSAQRRQPPPGAEAAEMERARPDASPDGAVRARVGTILREVWTDLGGDQLADLTNQAAFKSGKPSQSGHSDSFASPRDWADSYGTRMRGYVHPPATGNYTFWLNTDDEGKLWLSPDESPSAKVEICDQGGAVAHGNWGQSSKSKPIPLVKGRRYYIEAIQKEGGGSDHLLVGWQLPDGTMERPIPGKRLSAFIPGAEERLAVNLAAPAPGFALPAPGPVVVQVDVQGTASRVDVFHGSTRIGEARGNPHALTWNAPAPGAYPLAARLTERGGRTIVSKPVLVTVGEISLYRAVDLNGAEAVPVDDLPWQLAGSDVARHGTGFERQDLDLRHPTDAARARMIRSSIAARDGTRVSFSAVPPGKYLVHLYAWEPDDSPPAFDVTLNGKAVLSGHKFSAPGDWARLGPWAVDVADGKIELASRGHAHFSGIEVWRHGGLPVAPAERARTEVVGGAGGAGFEEVDDAHRMITGFRVSVWEKRHIKVVQAVYGDQEGELFGQLQSSEKVEILAKPGYAVGGVRVRGGDRLLAFQVIFMRINGPVLNPGDRYESPWIVGDASDTTVLGGTGAAIVGLHGRRGLDVDALGLVYLK